MTKTQVQKLAKYAAFASALLFVISFMLRPGASQP